MKNFKLYNVFFPIWFLLLIPITWLMAIPINFVVDSIVILLSLKVLKIDDSFKKYKKVIFKVFLFGFFADFIGAVLLFFIVDLIGRLPESSSIFAWLNSNILIPVMENPFSNIYGFLFMTVIIAMVGFFIYFFNLKFSFSKLDVEEQEKKKMALYMAVFTAPYLFYIPTAVIYNFQK